MFFYLIPQAMADEWFCRAYIAANVSDPWPLLLTSINFNPNMEVITSPESVGWNYLSIDE